MRESGGASVWHAGSLSSGKRRPQWLALSIVVQPFVGHSGCGPGPAVSCGPLVQEFLQQIVKGGETEGLARLDRMMAKKVTRAGQEGSSLAATRRPLVPLAQRRYRPLTTLVCRSHVAQVASHHWGAVLNVSGSGRLAWSPGAKELVYIQRLTWPGVPCAGVGGQVRETEDG
jgi:hypothetical protein